MQQLIKGSLQSPDSIDGKVDNEWGPIDPVKPPAAMTAVRRTYSVKAGHLYMTKTTFLNREVFSVVVVSSDTTEWQPNLPYGMTDSAVGYELWDVTP